MRSKWTKVNFIHIITIEHLLKHTLFIDYIAVEVSFFFRRSFYILCLILFWVCACMGSYVSIGLFTFLCLYLYVWGLCPQSSLCILQLLFFSNIESFMEMELRLSNQKALGNLFSLTPGSWDYKPTFLKMEFLSIE